MNIFYAMVSETPFHTKQLACNIVDIYIKYPQCTFCPFVCFVDFVVAFSQQSSFLPSISNRE